MLFFTVIALFYMPTSNTQNLFSPYPHQHLLVSACSFRMIVLKGIKWYLIVVLF